MITGKDELSIAILQAFRNGKRPSEVAKVFDVSLDQTKRLKRFFNYIQLLQDHTNESVVFSFRQLGLKGLVFAPLFQKEDYDGLTLLLQTADETIKRDDLKQLIKKYEAKQAKLEEMLEHQRQLQQSIEQQKELILETKEKIKEEQAKIDKELQFIEQYPIQAHDFLRKYIGPYTDNQFALRRRLDSGFRRALQKAKAIELVEYVWIVRNLDELVKQYIKRKTKGHYIEWNRDREWKRGSVAYDEDYSSVKSFFRDLEEMEYTLADIRQTFADNEEKMLEIKRQIQSLKKQSVYNFEIQSAVSNELSERELQHHADLQLKALKWIFNQDGVAVAEFTLPNGKRADVIGYLPDKTVIIVEVKASLQDYQRDQKWQDYIGYCDKFYFALDFWLQPTQFGLLRTHGHTLAVVYEDELQHEATNKEQLIYEINRVLAKKYIYGF